MGYYTTNWDQLDPLFRLLIDLDIRGGAIYARCRICGWRRDGPKFPAGHLSTTHGARHLVIE